MNLEILPQLLVNSLITGSIYALVSSGLSLNYGLSRVLNFAHGHLMMVGAYAFYLFTVRLQLPLALAIPCTGLVSMVVGRLSLDIFVQPFLRYSYQLPLVTTLALAAILEASISMGFGVNVKSLDPTQSESFELLGAYVTSFQIGIIASTIVLLLALGFFVHGTSLGRRIRALREHPAAAQSMGIPSRRMTRGVFVVATLLATFAGIMIGIETNLQPTMGNAYTIKAFAAMVLGGLGSIWGTVAGAYLLGLVENFSIGLDFAGYSLPSGYKDAFAYAIILLVLLCKPSGLFGGKARSV